MNRAAELPFGVLAAATAFALVPLAIHAWRSVAVLDASRSASHSEADALDPPDRVTANAHLVASVREIARSRGVRIDRLALPASTAAGFATLRLGVSGSQPAVLAFADALETDPRTIRFRRWKLQRVDDHMMLTGDGVTLLRLWR